MNKIEKLEKKISIFFLKKVKNLKKFSYRFLTDFGFRFSGMPKKHKPKILRKIKLFLGYDYDNSSRARKLEEDYKTEDSQFKNLDNLDQKIETKNINLVPKKSEILTNSEFWKERILSAESSKSDSEVQLSKTKNSIGDTLKEARTNLGFSLEKVSLDLKVNIRDVLALENNEIEKIGKNIYKIGFIYSYARLLRVPAKNIEAKIQDLDWQSNTKNKVYNLVNIGKSLDLKPSNDVFLKFLIASSLIFIAAVFVFSKIEDKSQNISNEQIITRLKEIKSVKPSAE